ncbi:hypothetical protein CEXT_541221 [Caerostris extrusa]|uniref:Uncharacterized protein n=1 Tax=Caerostris extrusa TaxID=172846 RepID=A0AAV4SNA2_CAEEX|nr:hypothetical protein CEXT_541221 [Caerostris extrusa]
MSYGQRKVVDSVCSRMDWGPETVVNENRCHARIWILGYRGHRWGKKWGRLKESIKRQAMGDKERHQVNFYEEEISVILVGGFHNSKRKLASGEK